MNPNLYRIFWHRSSSKLHNFSYSFLLLYNEAFWHIKQCKISTKVALDLISLPLDDLENYTKVPLSYCDISLQFVLEGAIKDFWGFWSNFVCKVLSLLKYCLDLISSHWKFKSRTENCLKIRGNLEGNFFLPFVCQKLAVVDFQWVFTAPSLTNEMA